MSPFRSVRLRLLLGLVSIIFVIIVGTLLLTGKAQVESLIAEAEARTRTTAQSTSLQLAEYLFTGDVAEIVGLAEKLDQQPGIRYVAVLDSTGKKIHDSQMDFHEAAAATQEFKNAFVSPAITDVVTEDATGHEVATFIAPVTWFDRIIGVVLVGYDRTEVYGQAAAQRNRILLLGLVGLAAGVILAYLLAGGITRPIERLKVAALEVGKGDFGRTIEVETRDEIGSLAESFNTMSLELLKREEEVRRSERLSAIGTTASAIAHEMKTPLTSMQAFTDLLQTKYDDPTFRKRFNDTVGPQIERLKTLVDDLLDYSRETRLHLTDLDLNLHIHQAVNVFRDLLAGHKVASLEEYGAQDLVKADPDKLEQVYFNLLKNAIEAVGEGGGVAIITEQTGDTVVTLVADSGTGIPEDVARRIFEPFFTTKSKGTGLGLAIVQKIVKAHGGTITLHTPLGGLPAERFEKVRAVLGDYWPGTEQGTCFEIRLPALTRADD